MDIALGSQTFDHPSPRPLLDAASARDKKQNDLLAALLDRLLAAKEPDGSSLFDHTMIVFGGSKRRVYMPGKFVGCGWTEGFGAGKSP